MGLGGRLLAAAVMGLATTAAAAEPEVLRLGAPAPEGTAWVSDCFEPFMRLVTSASSGRARIKAFWGAVLGDETAMVGLLLKDQIELWAGSAGALASSIPELHALELPYLFASDEEFAAVLRSPVRQEIRKLLARGGLVPLLFTEVGWRSFAGTRPYRRPSDLKGLPVRSQASPVHLEMWRQLEARPVTLGITALMPALEEGSVVALDQSPILLFATSWYQHTPYYTRSRHIYQPALTVMRLARLRSLAPPVQAALLKAGEQVERACFAGLHRQASEVEAHLADVGVKVVELTPAEQDAFRKHLQPVREAFRKSTTPAGRQLLAAIELALARIRARPHP